MFFQLSAECRRRAKILRPAYSKTLARSPARLEFREVLECGGRSAAEDTAFRRATKQRNAPEVWVPPKAVSSGHRTSRRWRAHRHASNSARFGVRWRERSG